MENQAAAKEQPSSPTRSDKSSESEGRPVREKLKETRIDAQACTDMPPSSDQPMKDTPTNGTYGDHSTSGSESERGRLRRKRSRENFEADQEEGKHLEKKPERHVRKKSRDVASPHESDFEIITKPECSIPPINETDNATLHSGEAPVRVEVSITDREMTPDAAVSSKDPGTNANPKNKRTYEQAEASAQMIAEPVTGTEEPAATATPQDERTTKRPRDGVDPEAGTAKEGKLKVPAAFSNTSATSPFGALTKSQASKPAEASANDQPQTSDAAFKGSGFGACLSSTSPFSVGGASAQSPFAASNGNKLTSFASSTKTSMTTPSGFADLGKNSEKSPLAGNTLGAVAGGFGTGFGSKSGFGGFGGASKLSTFGSGSGITGLTKKPGVPFGSKQQPQDSEEDDGSQDGDDDQEHEDPDHSAEPERRTSQPLLQTQGPLETGEENEDTIWTGRAKLYTLAGETGKKSWQERGVGAFKVNVTKEEPAKARFVLRADGTHRLLLNAALASTMRFGNAEGNKPEDGKLLFTAPTVSGEVESHLLKLKADRALELWKTVEFLKQTL